MVSASLLAVTQQICGFGSLHKPYNDLNSRFLVLASLFAVIQQICDFGFVSGRTKADLWFWLLHKPYNDLISSLVVVALLYWLYNDLNSKFLLLASVLAKQRLEMQICGFGISVGRKKADL